MVTAGSSQDFLNAQSSRLGEPIHLMTLVRVIEGPPLGSSLAFLLVGAAALHLVPAPGQPTIFGIPLVSDTEEEVSTLSYSKERVTFGPPQRGWWRAAFGPRDVVEVRVQGGSGPLCWEFQLHAPRRLFLADWSRHWANPI